MRTSADVAVPDNLEGRGIKPARWSPGRRIVFLFLCCYLLLYTAPDTGRVSLFSAIPGFSIAGRPYMNLWHALTPWVATRLFHLSGRATTYFLTGSGDTTLNYIENLLYVVVASVAAVVWFAVDRRRPHYRRVHEWLRILVRFTLAFTMLAYGFAKVFPLQFPYPSFIKLTEAYGDFSPMGVLWSFMGASPAYVIFSGAAEITGGLLLLTRRTTTLGALVCVGVLTNVVALNFCYDVPVKLYSVNLLLMAIFLAMADLRRLTNLLLLNRTAAPADLSVRMFSRRWSRIAAVTFEALFALAYVTGQAWGGWSQYARVHAPSGVPIYGLYDVETFTVNGQARPPLLTDATRWNKVLLESPTVFRARLMDNTLRTWTALYDSAESTVTISSSGTSPNVFRYSRPDAGHILMEGKFGGEALSVRLRRFDLSGFQLVSRGFHWINEFPFNR